MYNLIAPSFFQKKSCKLPGIGQLTLITHPAETDFLNTQIKAPYQEIVFTAEQGNEKVFNEFSAISEMMKRKLDTEAVELDGIGVFTKGKAGAIHFTAIQPAAVLYPAATAERVIRQDARHDILVGDKESNNVLMTEYYSEDIAGTKDLWWVWAIGLAAISIAVIAYHFYTHGRSGFLGNSAGL